MSSADVSIIYNGFLGYVYGCGMRYTSAISLLAKGLNKIKLNIARLPTTMNIETNPIIVHSTATKLFVLKIYIRTKLILYIVLRRGMQGQTYIVERTTYI